MDTVKHPLSTPCRCCREGACPGASAPHGFAEELSKCVQVRVRPNNVSVTSPGVQVSDVAVGGIGQCMRLLGVYPAESSAFPS